ncbi:MAG: hypothetical protein JWR38_5290 [Mucilaginibacter sp.]|nr:hypothetical protein [Mucilaginibacter sp.]
MDLSGLSSITTIPALTTWLHQNCLTPIRPAMTGSDIGTILQKVVTIAGGGNYYVGRYTSSADLQTAHPTGSDGQYATVDAGSGSDAVQYIWDSTDNIWVAGGAGDVASVNGQTGEVLLLSDDIGEGDTNKYFTAARAIASALTGLGLGDTSAVIAADNIVQAVGKLQAQINDLPTESYTLPVATTSVLGGVKQGANIHINGNGFISAIQTDADANKQTGSLLLLNTAKYFVFGDSISAGYGASNAFRSWTRRFAAQIGFSQVYNNYAFSGTTVIYSTGLANKNLPIGGRDTLVTWMVGLNDCRNFGDVAVLYSTIQNAVTTFLATCFLSTATSGANCTETGAWDNTFDTTNWGGKSPFLPFGTLKAAISTTIGSTKSITLDWFEDTVVIGTLSSDGRSGNELGAFDIFINDVFYMTYDPNGRNHGVVSILDTPVTRQKWAPDVIVIKGCEQATVKIVTKSTTPTVIDYIGKLSAPQGCSPVICSLIPSIDFVGHPDVALLATQSVIDNANNAIKMAVFGFSGFPVSLVDPNKYWDVTVNNTDGLHPNDLGHLQVSRSFFEAVMGSSTYYVDPHKDQVISGLTVGQGSQTTFGTNGLGAALGLNALSNNTIGYDNVAVGGFAGRENTTGIQNVFIGRQAGHQNAVGNNNTYVGWLAGNNGTGGNNTIIGANAVLPNSVNNDSILLASGGMGRFIQLDGSLTVKGMDTPTASTDTPSTHKVPIKINGDIYYLLLSTV